ncbi:MAG: hypothetical protein Fur0025_22640 [Oscillatoriaceae cyanobacterium]
MRQQILSLLNKASDEEVLKTKPHEIHNLLKLEKSEKDGKGVYEIIGGPPKRNIKRTRNLPHFERFDGCWFDFTILIDQHPKSAEIFGFSFEIRFPDDYPVKFLRIDLNTPGHNNDMRGMRFHVHPGSDDFRIHSAPMSPLEILHLFLYGLDISKRRSSS